MSEATILQLISSSGAAVISFYVIIMFMTGRIHSDSELDAYREQNEKLHRMNETVVDRLKQVNDIFEKAIERGYTSRRDQ